MKKYRLPIAVLCLFGAALAAQQTGGGAAPATEQSMPPETAPSSATSAPAGTRGDTVITLQQALNAAIAHGPDIQVVRATLDVARAQHALDASKEGLSLAASGGYGAIDGLGTAYSDSSFSSYKSSFSSLLGTTSSDVTQSLTGGLALSGPTTKLGLALTQSVPPPNASTNALVTGAQLSLTQTVWDGYPGGQVKAAVDKSLLVLQGKELSATQGQSAALAKVKQAYITMLTDQRALTVKRQIQSNQNNLLAQIQAVYNLKQASTVDLMTAQVNARSAELDAAQAEHDLRLARQRLAVLLGLPPDSQFSVAEVDEPSLPAASLEEAIAIGLRKRADLAQLDLSKRSSGIDLLLAKASAQPNVSMTGGYDVAFAQSSDLTLGAASVSAGVKVSMPILDAGASRDQAAAASRQMAVYDAQRSQLALGIATDIKDAYENALILKDRVDLASKNMTVLEAQFALEKTQNQYGTATMQDVLTASVNAANGENAYQGARNAYLLGILTLETDMGL